MQGEYNGKPIFKHRYIGMNEEEIRAEIDRLQSEIYSMEEYLEFYRKDNVQLRGEITAAQQQNEKLLRSLEFKVQNLQDALDYTKPLKSRLDTIVKEFEVNLESLYNTEGIKKQQRNVSVLTTLTVINTILILCVIGLVGFSIFFY